MQQILLPLFYNLQHIIRASNFYRKYHLIFQSLDLSSKAGYARNPTRSDKELIFTMKEEKFTRLASSAKRVKGIEMTVH